MAQLGQDHSFDHGCRIKQHSLFQLYNIEFCNIVHQRWATDIELHPVKNIQLFFSESEPGSDLYIFQTSESDLDFQIFTPIFLKFGIFSGV